MAVSRYTRAQFVADLRIALRTAAGISIVAAIGVALMGLFAITAKGPNGTRMASVTDVTVTYGAIVVAYFATALLAAVAVFLFRPLRSRTAGWALTGAVVAPCCYLPLITALGLLRTHTGWLLALKGQTPFEGREIAPLLLFMTILAMPIGAAAGVYWRDNPP